VVTAAEQREIGYALDDFAAQNPDAVRPEAVDPLLLGIASHHAGLAGQDANRSPRHPPHCKP